MGERSHATSMVDGINDLHKIQVLEKVQLTTSVICHLKVNYSSQALFLQ